MIHVMFPTAQVTPELTSFSVKPTGLTILFKENDSTSPFCKQKLTKTSHRTYYRRQPWSN